MDCGKCREVDGFPHLDSECHLPGGCGESLVEFHVEYVSSAFELRLIVEPVFPFLRIFLGHALHVGS